MCLRDIECNVVREIPIVCAVTALYSVDYDVVLPTNLIRNLQVPAGAVSASGCVASNVCDVTTENDHPEFEDNIREKVDRYHTGRVKSASNFTSFVWFGLCNVTRANLYMCLLIMLFDSADFCADLLLMLLCL